jgi:hypothetical protein
VAYKQGNVAADAVILATPTQTHVALAQAFRDSRLAVLIEKPLCGSGQDGKALLELAKQDRQGVYMVGHHRRHNAYVKIVKQVLEQEKLGEITAINGGESCYLVVKAGSDQCVNSLGDAQARWLLRYPLAYTTWSRRRGRFR